MQIKRTLPLSTFLILFIPCLVNCSAYGQTRRTGSRTKTVAKQKLLIQQGIAEAAPISSCRMTLEQSPAIRGFRLGMNLDEVTQRLSDTMRRNVASKVAQLKTRTTYAGHFSLEVMNDQFANLDDSRGIRYVRFSFLDERLIQIYVDYSSDENWQNISQFVDVISPSLNLSHKWDMPDARTALLDCGSFRIEASLRGLLREPSLTLTNTAGKQEAAERKEETNRRKREEEEKRRKDFKP